MTGKKYVLLAGIGIAMTLAATGCADTRETEKSSVNPVEALPPDTETEAPDAEKAEPSDPVSQDNGDSAETDGTDTDGADTVRKAAAEIIGGKVRSIEQNSFVISRTLIDEEGYVKMPEAGSADEQLVTVLCTSDTAFELWEISGGGAGIETSEAAFTDLAVGSGLEAEGYFDGEEFVANRVIIEIYE